jgi:hypothetical protein
MFTDDPVADDSAGTDSTTDFAADTSGSADAGHADFTGATSDELGAGHPDEQSGDSDASEPTDPTVGTATIGDEPTDPTASTETIGAEPTLEQPAQPADGSDGTTTVAAQAGTGEDLVLTGPDGSEVQLGAANVSVDGQYDAVAVETDSGGVEVYADADHNGTVDAAISIQPDGSFAVWAPDGAGHWHVESTGHIDSSGNAVLDASVDPAASQHPPAAIAGDVTTNGPATPATPATPGAPATPATPATPGSSAADDAAGTYPGVAPGDLAVADGNTYLDAGPATYDMDGDGTADTAVVQSDDRIIQVSDTDGDGRADEMLQVDTQTHQAAILTDDGSGTWTVQAQGTISADGDFVPNGSAIDAGSAVDAGAGAGTQDIVYTDASGERTDLGRPDQDLDGDGVPESVVVQGGDGSYLIVSDVDGNGTPDQIIALDPDTGRAEWAVPDGAGNWSVVATGHVNADGTLVMDQQAATAQDPTAQGSTAQDPSGDSDGQNAQFTGVGQAPADQPAPGGADHDESVSVAVDGQIFNAGRATLDENGDGVADTVTMPGPDNSTLYYQDSDGDGVADRAWTTDASGQVTASYTLDAQGEWTPAAGAAGVQAPAAATASTSEPV